MFTAAATILFPLLAASSSPVLPPSDGLYLRGDGEAGMTALTAAGTPLPIDAPFTAVPTRATLQSLSNDNELMILSLNLPRAEVPEPLHLVLVCEDVAHAQVGWNTSSTHDPSANFRIEGLAHAKAVAAHFGIEPRLRAHPGHRLRISFVQVDSQPDAPVRARMRIVNVGDEPVMFLRGGRNRAARDNQYVFSARFAGRQVDDIGTSRHFGGLGTTRTIAPGEAFEDIIDLTRWFAFEEPGGYEVLGSYFMEFHDGPSWSPVWEDYATAAFHIDVPG